MVPLAPPVTTASILREATLANLARPQRFTLGQDSSYDRRSKERGTDDWFANDDWGHYLREEENGGRQEWVMADLKGPGALVRQWTANPQGTVRYYFDGETEPRFLLKRAEVEAGTFLGLGEPYAYLASRGYNVYLPMGYARSLKVTVEGEGGDGGDPAKMYYILGHRAYPAGTDVRSFSREDLAALPPPPARLGAITSASVSGESVSGAPMVLPPGAARALVDRTGPGEVVTLRLRPDFPALPSGAAWRDPRQRHEILRHLVIEAEFDGELCIAAPVSDLFGAPPDGRPYRTEISQVDADATMTLRLRMPFHRSAHIRLRNGGSVDAKLHATVALNRSVAPDALLLHAQYRREPGGSRPNRDMPVAHLKGSGHYVGTVLSVANPVRAWWGEGDEKVSVDGEAFPAIFGTGTEDYFGYAWSSNVPFAKPYHAQPRAEHFGNLGHVANVRWHVLDPIPYEKSLDFDLEIWHWADAPGAVYSTTAFWYAAPGGTPARTLLPVDLTTPEIPLPKPEPGAFQGETLAIVGKTGGTTEIQSGFDDLPDAQLWWRDAKVGDTLTLRLPSVKPGRYRVEIRACIAKDYGVHEMTLGGEPLGAKDFYSPDLAWRRFDLGEVTLKSGAPELTVTARESNPSAEPRRMFGLDWIKLVRVR